MEPILVTEPGLLEIEAELASREPIFHRPEWGTSRADYERMTAPDFWEVGASGRRYSREHVLAVLEERRKAPQPDPWETRDFHCRRISDDAYLLTYTLQLLERKTRRATLWQRTPEGWKILYHQGTLVERS